MEFITLEVNCFGFHIGIFTKLLEKESVVIYVKFYKWFKIHSICHKICKFKTFAYLILE